MSAQDVINATTSMLTKGEGLVTKLSPKMLTLTQIASAANAAADRSEDALAACQQLIAGSTPGGGTTTPTPSTGAAANIAKIKAAMLTAPTTAAAIPRKAVAVTRGNANGTPNAIPGANGAYERHWLSGNGTQGFADMATKTIVRPLDTAAPGFGGLVRFEEGDGSNAHGYMQGMGIPNYSGGDISDFGVGMYHTGRAIGFCGSNNRACNLYVDELDGTGLVLVTGRQSWTGDGQWIYYDFTTSKRRVLYFRGGADGVFGLLAVKPGDILEPWDFLTNSFQISYMGDSWGQGGAWNTIGLSLPQMMGHMIGSRFMVGSSIGGTGYVIEQGRINAMNEERRASINSGDSAAVLTALGVNDPFNDAFVTNVNAYYDRLRSDKPNTVIVGISWCSAENRASGTGAEVQRRNTVKAKVMSLPGPWIYIDGFDGMWYTSKGTQKGAATGPFVTGNGSVASPTGTGNADLWIDNNDGRHPTEVGNQGLAKLFGDNFRQAAATM